MTKELEAEPFGSLWRYWNDVRGDAQLPGRDQIDVSRLHDTLPNVSLIEIKDTETMIYRLVGSDIVARYGAELTGINLMDILSPDAKAPAARAILATSSQPCVGFSRSYIRYNSGVTAGWSVVAVPLTPIEGDLGRILMVQKSERDDPRYLNDSPAAIGVKTWEANFFDIGAGAADPFVLDIAG